MDVSYSRRQTVDCGNRTRRPAVVRLRARSDIIQQVRELCKGIDDLADEKDRQGCATTLDDAGITKMMKALWTHRENLFGLTADNFPEIPACFTDIIPSLHLREPSRRNVP